jgi:hypothetical protein
MTKLAIRSRLLGALKLAIALCMHASLIACHSGEESQPNRSASNTSQPEGNCAGSGPLACTVAPTSDLAVGACEQLRKCMTGRAIDDATVGQIRRCEAPGFLALPSGAHLIAVVSIEVEIEGPPSHASYLFVRGEQGWCPAATVLEPLWQHGGTCEADIEASGVDSEHRSPAGGLLLRAERICRIPLDQAEMSTGESSVVEHECVTSKFDWNNGGLKLRSANRSDGKCRP